MTIGLSTRVHHFSLIWIFWISVVSCHYTRGEIPINLVHDHIKNHVDYSIDPCHDFYAHVCPATSPNRFLIMLENIKDDLVHEHKKNYPFFNKFVCSIIHLLSPMNRIFLSTEVMTDTSEVLKSLKNANSSNEYFSEDIANISLDGFDNFTEDEKDQLLKRIVDGNNYYVQYKKELNDASNAYIASLLFDKLDLKARQFFKMVKAAVRKSINNTPWARTNNSTGLFQNALEQINFYTFRDARDAVKIYMEKYNSAFNVCFEMISQGYGNEIGSALCDVLALHQSRRIFDQQNVEIIRNIRASMLSDKLNMFNAGEKTVFFSSAVLLLFNSDYKSDVYGSIGFTLLHEVFHSLVFGQQDQVEQHPLIPYWTKNSECVAEQAMKTCTTFPTIKGLDGNQGCDPQETFEEDAADMAAYRIAWDLYKKQYARKTVVKHFESLTIQQLFFYGAATLLCNPEAMTVKENSGTLHSNDYQRINSLMSQMPAFGRAFKCNATDLMMVNKGKHCVLYGSGAPYTRKNNID